MTKIAKYFGLLIVVAMLIGAVATVWAADKVNINTAKEEELTKLHRVTPTLAKAIVEYRSQNGNFRTIEDLKRVKGFDEKMLQLNKDLMTVGDEAKDKKKQ